MNRFPPPIDTVDEVVNYSQKQHDHIDRLHDAMDDLFSAIERAGINDTAVHEAVIVACSVMVKRP